MDFGWVLMIAAVRLLVLIVPFMGVEAEFNLGEKLGEAREFATASACKGMLVSFPVVFFFTLMAEVDKRCQGGPAPTFIGLYVVVGFLVVYMLMKIPAHVYRGTAVPIVWFTFLSILDVLAQLVIGAIALWTCR